MPAKGLTGRAERGIVGLSVKWYNHLTKKSTAGGEFSNAPGPPCLCGPGRNGKEGMDMEKIGFYLAHRSGGAIPVEAMVFSNLYGLLGKTKGAEALLEECRRRWRTE